MREQQTDVLVVGAGPVGLLAAVALAGRGIDVQVIDQEERTAARSYACALHARSLHLLQRLGVIAPLLEQGRRVERIAFYEGDTRQTELDLRGLDTEFPFILVLPQSALESALEKRLHEMGAPPVLWNHRCAELEPADEEVQVLLEQLSGTSTGYIVPHWETVVKRRTAIHASFVLGADGQHSFVRRRLALPHDLLVGPQFFAVCEFLSDWESDQEVRVVLDEATTNVLWPLPGSACRWSCQLLHSDASKEFPVKDRRSFRAASDAMDAELRNHLLQLLGRRAPWFTGRIDEILWCTVVEFEQRIARSFGQGRCWLAGDAAHQTGPVGMQSMNAGLAEADALSNAFYSILRQDASIEALTQYNRESLTQWRQLLTPPEPVAPTPEASWPLAHTSRMLSCLPATGHDLATLARLVGLQIQEPTVHELTT